MAIRQYFTMLYYRIYKDSEELYNQTDLRAVNQLLAQLKALMKISLIFIYLNIMYWWR